jgi:hypothetical protein
MSAHLSRREHLVKWIVGAGPLLRVKPVLGSFDTERRKPVGLRHVANERGSRCRTCVRQIRRSLIVPVTQALVRCDAVNRGLGDRLSPSFYSRYLAVSGSGTQGPTMRSSRLASGVTSCRLSSQRLNLDVEAVEKLRFHLARRECTAHDARIALVGDRTRCRTSRWWITVRAFYP